MSLNILIMMTLKSIVKLATFVVFAATFSMCSSYNNEELNMDNGKGNCTTREITVDLPGIQYKEKKVDPCDKPDCPEKKK